MNIKLSFEEKYDAIGKAESDYEGVFYTGVVTTGIFCRPSCRARKPKPENVIFYDTAQQAIQNGFRPCKICKPMEQAGETPDYIKNLINELHADPYLKIKDYDLRQRGIEPSQIRRWFKKHHNMTFHAYQRMMRINKAYNQIRGGNSVTNTAFGVGYDSLSGFNEGYRKIFSNSPTGDQSKNVINIIRFTTKLGPMFACATEKGLCLLEFTDRRMLEREFQDLCKRLDAVILPGQNPILSQVQEEIAEYMEGKRSNFTVPLHSPGTDFQNSVWDLLKNIPYGETRSYQEQANLLGKPKAVRAVANANGMNRIAIIIPCHRVIGSNGELTGYAGGLGRKKWLLEMEKQCCESPKTGESSTK
ncbi:bifunctional transcriptional activator/DNA repair enzyme AdaA [Marinifilum caeruleilacunae]|uniref:Methylated-DNA--protein-cysteine methyltransferase n=1 Tax=Marinifilum caeruleilacunae TaxID=2499076 RepID=A0ABX1WRF5_9BACT|nr:methylated-DNA--[protein]-cysteine S-methyltransferase [Marinifilum caeruleilacunae]NOU58661.1 methylated-DNA--[protein]-cysteine S-methyltransferase [Marinifilum caeruleilacunae]